jgi:hypothetical protein
VRDTWLIESQDPLFSNQEHRQVVGRVWRHPQQRQVIAYRLLAMKTADTILQEIADNKDFLLKAFQSTNLNVAKGEYANNPPLLSPISS